MNQQNRKFSIPNTKLTILLSDSVYLPPLKLALKRGEVIEVICHINKME